MSEVSDFLGLPSFNFDSVVNEGMYNVGGHEGYDTITEWTDGKDEVNPKSKKKYDGIPISDDLKKRYLAFVKPFNERLFELADKRCDW